MKALFIGGTGTISTAITDRCLKEGWELYLLNRGNKSLPAGARHIEADMNDEADVAAKLKDMDFDVVADFIAFTKPQVERDVRLFAGRTRQYVFISSASAYQKPLASPYITESTPLHNPFWEYSRNKAICEQRLLDEYRKTGFPITLVRPSHTYGDAGVPVSCHGRNGSFSVIERIRQGKKVIVPGDGLTLWTLTHNTDFAKAFCGLMGNVHAIGEAYQITGDESLTWNQIYQIIGDALGVEAKLVHIPSETLAACCESFSGELLGDKSNTVIFDNAKIKRAVPGYRATVRFDQGVRQTLAYIYSHEECQIPDPEFDAWTDQVIEQYESMAAALPRLQK